MNSSERKHESTPLYKKRRKLEYLTSSVPVFNALSIYHALHKRQVLGGTDSTNKISEIFSPKISDFATVRLGDILSNY
jgi:hypothetical protein